jgi:MoaA/NifB/PqqE/SkfB family radical SAM enzyme
MKYDVEADWHLLETCNFRCAYCFSSPELLGTKIRPCGTPTAWSEGFDSSEKTWLLHLTGGEPSIYPGFVDLCRYLTRKHYISLNSNLSHRSIDQWTSAIDPSRVNFINAALHFEERSRKSNVKSFTDRVKKLKSKGFPVFVSQVMTPSILEIFPEICARFENDGIYIIPKVIRSGRFKESHLPQGYSRDQKQLIEDHLRRSWDNYRPFLEQEKLDLSIDIFSDARFLEGRKDYRGRTCTAGSRFVAIVPNGTILRCRSGQILGNVLLKDYFLLDSALLCDTSYCPYFCEKYSVETSEGSDSIKQRGAESSFAAKSARLKGKFLSAYYTMRTGGSGAAGRNLLKKVRRKFGNGQGCR